MAAAETLWSGGEIQAFLLDISGVLYNCGSDGGSAIPGSVDAVQRLKSAGVPVRFVTNETSCTRRHLVEKLRGFGFDLEEREVFSPAPAVKHVLQERGLRPHMLIDKAAEPDYSDVDQSDPNCVVLADAGERFTYQALNQAFQVLMGRDKPVIFSLGKGRYYQTGEGLYMDVGCFTKALEYAVGVEAEVVGKPSRTFFTTAVSDIGLAANKVVMVGDDIVSDVGGAQKSGIHGVLVRTGKYRPSDANHPSVKPDDIVDNLVEAVDRFFAHRRQ